MKTFVGLLSLSTAAFAAPSRGTHFLPQQTCCFTLAEASSSSPVQQDTNGWLYLKHPSHPVETYCLDIQAGSDILRDPWNSACYIDPDGKAKCSDPTPSDDVWAIEGNGAGEKSLVVNGGSEFLACGGDNGEQIWKEGQTGCRVFEIVPADLEGGC